MSSAALAQELILGRYRPLRPLGSGGMGHVWLARDEETGLDIALKVVAREGKAAVRAEREAKAAASLRHPRCQRIYALARDSGHVYIAYEYIPGRTLREAMTAGEIGDREAVEVAAQVLEALAHAHRRGIVHRDVKPSNVLLAESDDGVDVRLLDFGLAQMAEFDTLTAKGDVPGTLAYVSPERLLGEEATEAADIWAVGVMLWEALAQSHPFRGSTMNETSNRIQAGAKPLEHLRPDLPAAVHSAVASALVLNPARRPSAGRLADELRSRAKKRRGKGSGTSVTKAPPRALATTALRERALPATLAAVTAGWVASALPFYPAGWALGLAAAAGTIAAVSPRIGMAVALATAFLPLANISLGLAALFAAVACGYVALMWRDARYGLLFAAGPLLMPVAALGLIPLAAQFARGRTRRAVHTVTAVLTATLVAGARHEHFPFEVDPTPTSLGIEGSTQPMPVARELWAVLGAHPALLKEAFVLAAVAVALPYFRGRGPWAAAALGAAFLATTALAAPAAPLVPLIAAAWITAALLGLERTNYTDSPG